MHRLAADLGHLLDELLMEAGPSHVRASERHGLTAAQAQVLLALDQARGPLPLVALADRTQRSIVSVGRLVERLRGKALVVHRDGVPEGRSDRIQLSASGRAHLRALQADRRQQLESYVHDMGTARRLRLAAALHLLSSHLDEELADPDLPAATAAA